MKNTKKIKFRDIQGMLERDEMREIIGGSGNPTGSGGNGFGGGGGTTALNGGTGFGSSFTGSNYGGFGGNNAIGGGVYAGLPNPTGAGESSYPGSPYYNGGSSSSSNSVSVNSSVLNSGYGGGWYTSYNYGKVTTDLVTINRFFEFVYANKGVVTNNQINTFVNNELTIPGQQQNTIQYNITQLPGTVLNNVTVINNYKGPSTIPQGIVTDKISLFVNNSVSTGGTGDINSIVNNTSWYAMPIHGSSSKPSPLEAAYMSKAVYGDNVDPKDLANWAVSKEVTGVAYDNPESGFKSQLYERTMNGKKQYCYVTAGTEASIADIAADVVQVAGLSLQYQESVNNAKALKAIFGDALSFAGHSLGGGMAEANARATGQSATTFNAAGLSPVTAISLNIGFISDTHSYIMVGDPLNAIQKLSPILSTAGGQKHYLSAASQSGAMNSHSIDSVIESIRNNKSY